MNYESDMKRLEEITVLLRSRETPLDEAIKLFEEGLEVSARLEGKLTEVEGKIEKLTANGREPFN